LALKTRQVTGVMLRGEASMLVLSLSMLKLPLLLPPMAGALVSSSSMSLPVLPCKPCARPDDAQRTAPVA
jgi:hypothetical protein